MINRAYQVDPSYQNSRFDFSCYEDVVFIGNRNFSGNDKDSDWGNCTEKFHDVMFEIMELGHGKPKFDKKNVTLDEWRDILTEVGFDRGKNEQEYSDEELQQFRALFLKWMGLFGAYTKAMKSDIDRPRCARELGEFEENLEMSLYSLWKGKEYDTTTLRGFSQGEWIEIVYPKTEYCREQLRAIESEYFNTGTEWAIKSGEHKPDCDCEPECACEDNWHEFYCYVCDNEDVRSTLQGCLSKGEELEIYEFAGYSKTAKYKRYE